MQFLDFYNKMCKRKKNPQFYLDEIKNEATFR